MSKDRVKLVGWICLDGYTLRWRRGDPTAYVYRSHQILIADSNTEPSTSSAFRRAVGRIWLRCGV